MTNIDTKKKMHALGMDADQGQEADLQNNYAKVFIVSKSAE